MENWPLFYVIVLGLGMIGILVVSANLSVKKLIGVAAYFNLSSTFMGMTVVSLATSIPEITSHFTASAKILSGSLDFRIGSSIVLGSNIGSDVFQQTFILGLVVLLTGTMHFRRYFMWKSMVPMIAASALCIVLGLDRVYSRWDGLILFGTFILYSLYLFFDERKFFQAEDNVHMSEEISDSIPITKKQVLLDSLISVLLLIVTVLAASQVLRATEIIVNRTNISGSLLGVVTLGLASAMPELSTALAGVRHKEFGISLGTLIGSNITNPLVGIGLGALVSTYAVPRPLLLWDLPWATLTGILLWIILWARKGKLGKVEGFYLMAMYFVFVVLRAVLFPVDF
ncbi:MAG: sodium:calcium antiporter [Anaerolineaceae bacterium]|jgi:Ca2+/Na+ antiporter